MLFFNDPLIIVVNLIVLGIGMTIHEFAHNYVGDMMGDPVPRQQGRLTLNPMVHIHPIGWLMFAIIGFGILGSAPISARRMRDPRWGFMYAVAAGPLSNLGIAVVFGIIIRIMGVETLATMPDFIRLLLIQMVFLNVLLFVFNLLPLFPLDGWHIVLSLLPGYWLSRSQVPVFVQQNARPLSAFLQQPAYKWANWSQVTYYIFIGLIFLSIAQSMLGIGFIPNILAILISEPTRVISFFLMGLG